MRYRLLIILISCLISNVFIGTTRASSPDKSAPTPPNRETGTYFSIYSNAENYVANYCNWGKTYDSEFTIPDSGNDVCRKINMTHSGASIYTSASLTNVINTVSDEYTNVHFDIWFDSTIVANQLRFELYNSAPENMSYNYLYHFIPEISESDVDNWLSFDVDLESLTRGWGTFEKEVILSDIKSLRFALRGDDLTVSFYVDNIYFYKKDNSIPSSETITPPQLSSVWGSDKVVSIFSNVYENTDESSLVFSPEKIDFYINEETNHSIWRFNNTDNILIEPSSGSLDISEMDRFHIDIWTKEAKNFNLILKDKDVEVYSMPYSTHGDKWTSIDIELPEDISSRSNLEIVEYINSISSIEIVGDNSNYFIDNIYFYSTLVEENSMYSSIMEANKALGRGINLGNAFEEQGYNPSGGNKFTIALAKEFVDKIASINQVSTSGNKFDHIRIPVRWDLWGKDDNENDITDRERIYRTDTAFPYNIETEFMADVKEVVDYILSKDLKVVLNIHHYNPFYKSAGTINYNTEKARFFAIWSQIADQFKFYDHNLFFEMLNEPRDPMTFKIWNELIPETLPYMRKGGVNSSRPILIASSDWGGFPRLELLELPTGELAENLIATVHFYNPAYIANQGETGSSGFNTEIDWWDTQEERDLVLSFISVADQFQEKYPEVPIYVGELGATKKAETDSRSLWLTYIRDVFEKREYSWAYWEFRAGYGIASYSESSNTINYNIPIVDALLSNDAPKRPAGHSIQSVEPANIIFDLNVNGNAGWTNKDASDNNLLVKEFIPSGGSGIWGPGYSALNYANGKATSCRISFKASSTKEGINYLVSTNSNYLSPKSVDKSAKTSEFIFSPGLEETEYSFIVDLLEQPSVKGVISFRINSSLENAPVTLTIKDLIIEEVEKRHEAAPVPSFLDEKVTNIFSTEYGITSPSFTGEGTQSYIKDNSNTTGNDIIQIADFNNQTITPSSPITIGEKKTLNLCIYAGSQMHGLTVKVNGEGGSVEKTYLLPSHEWQVLDIDLNELTTISSIELSGGTGNGRKIFLDHIYLNEISNDALVLVWTGYEDDDWNNPLNWIDELGETNKYIPGAKTSVYIPGNLNTYPLLKGNKSSNQCKDIYFMSGAELGRQDLLTYQKVHIQYDFGLYGSTQKESTDVSQHLAFSAKNSTPLERDQWHMLSAPINGLTVGDFSIGAYPVTYMRLFEASESEEQSFAEGRWVEKISSLSEVMKAGEGFVFWMPDYKDEKYYQESIGVDDNEKGLKALNGILEFPFYENADMSKAHRNHTYKEDENKSRFYLIDTESLNITSKYVEVSRSDIDYKFVNNDGNFSYSKEISNTDPRFLFIGNPYMYPIDFDKFSAMNNSVIKEHYYIWNQETTSYDTYISGINTEEFSLKPMQGFIVELADDILGSINLTYPISEILAGVSSNEQPTPAPAKDDSFENILKITAINTAGKVSTWISRPNADKETLDNRNARKMLAGIHKLPEVYSIKQSEKKNKGFSLQAIDKQNQTIPLGLASSFRGEMKFLLTGMNKFEDNVYFIDLHKDIENDISNMESFEYTFSYSPTVENGKTIPNESRFFIRIETDKDSDNSGYSYYVHNYPNEICIETDKANPIKEIYLYDQQGRLILKDLSIEQTLYTIKKGDGIPCVCFAKLVCKEETKTLKLIIE